MMDRLRPITRTIDDRGWLAELTKESMDGRLEHVYVTSCLPGVVKAWHKHESQDDHFVLLDGDALRVVLHDGSHYTQPEQYILLPFSHVLTIPRGLWHGFSALGTRPAVVLNVTNIEYDASHPDEIRAAPDEFFPAVWRTINR